jgi:hypothetical protein
MVKDLHLAFLGSKGTTNVGTSQALIGAQLAVDIINRNQILPGYRLAPVEKLSRVSRVLPMVWLTDVVDTLNCVRNL